MRSTNQHRQSSSRKRLLSPRAKKLIRRTHLYLGLFLIPWLLLYGVTALLFNHGEWMTNRKYNTLPAQAEAYLPAAAKAAESAIDGLSEQLSLVPESAQWLGTFSLNGETNNTEVFIRISPQGGIMMSRPQKKEQPTWTETKLDWSVLDAESQDELKAATLTLAQHQTPELESLSIKRFPVLRFQLQDEQQKYTVDLKSNGQLTVQTETTLRSKLLRLHTLHGSPGYLGARWLWARAVDAMGVAMIVWGLTGLIMWWSIKPTRIRGGVALFIGITIIVVLAISIWMALGMV